MMIVIEQQHSLIVERPLCLLWKWVHSILL